MSDAVIKKIIRKMIEKRRGDISNRNIMRRALMSVVVEQDDLGRVTDKDGMLEYINMMLDEFYIGPEPV